MKTYVSVGSARAVGDRASNSATVTIFGSVEPVFVVRGCVGAASRGHPNSRAAKPWRVMLLVAFRQHSLHTSVVEGCIASDGKSIQPKVDFGARSLREAKEDNWRLCEQRDEHRDDYYDQPASSEAQRVVRLSRLDIEPCLTEELLPNRRTEQSQEILLCSARIDRMPGGHDACEEASQWREVREERDDQ